MNAQTKQKNTWLALKADTFRQHGRFSWRNLIADTLTKRTFRVIVTMRLCQMVACSHGAVRFTLPLFKILHRIAANTAAVDLSWRTEIGSGLAITHGWGLVVNPGAKIGANVTLFHGATLGRSDRIQPNGERITGYPTLEDEVWVGPHAIIVGGVTIGRGSRIAGGAFVTESVSPYSIVIGNPATIVKSNCIPDVMNPAPINSSSAKLRSEV
jgi:serine O-acetyltransferase